MSGELRPRVQTTQSFTKTRTVRIAYDGPELTLGMLRDFVHRTRNQRRIPNWADDTLVGFDEIDGTIELTVTETVRDDGEQGELL